MGACAKELSGLLRQQLLARPDEAAECIQMIAKLGEPTESLQVGALWRGAGGKVGSCLQLCCWAYMKDAARQGQNLAS